MASDAIALDAIAYLKNSKEFPLACIVSNPDKPKGRGNKVQPNDVSAWALENGVELLRPEKGPDEFTVSKMRELGVELIIVMAYGCILRKNILEYNENPVLNIHASVLPQLRGASPIETALALGFKETGASLMKIVPRMDAGPVCAVKKIAVDARETSQTLRAKFRKMSAQLLNENLQSIKNGTAKFEEQNENEATYARKLNKDDMRLNFNMPANVLDDRIRAFGFGLLDFKGETIKVCDAHAVHSASHSAVGTVLQADANGLEVACAEGSLLIKSLQRPCAKMMCAEEFFKGFCIEKKSVLKSFANAELLRA